MRCIRWWWGERGNGQVVLTRGLGRGVGSGLFLVEVIGVFVDEFVLGDFVLDFLHELADFPL